MRNRFEFKKIIYLNFIFVEYQFFFIKCILKFMPKLIQQTELKKFQFYLQNAKIKKLKNFILQPIT